MKRLLPLLALAGLNLACADMAASPAGEFGATQGGIQDMKVARELIANGQVPPPEAFVVEGMFSEHDLPLAGASCTNTLCLRTAAGVAPTLAGESSAWVQIGMSSSIDPETFHRPNLALVFTVDVSGSMGWDYSSSEQAYPTPGALSRKLMHAIAAQLGPGDRVAMVAYGSESEVLLPFTPGDDPALRSAIDSLHEDGSTNMEAGLKDAYALGRLAHTSSWAVPSADVRVLLFTDAQPNVGASTPTEFETLAADGARDRVGLTVFALGLGIGQEVLDAISHLRGGNAFSLFKPEDVDALIADSWPWMVTPIAYDLRVELTAGPGYRVMEGYGFPNGAGAPSSKLEVSTVFLSRRRGALLVRVAPDAGQALGSFRVGGSLSYETPTGLQVTEGGNATYAGEPLDGSGQWFEQRSTAKAVALAVLVSGMRDAAATYGDNPAAAQQLMAKVVARCEADAASLKDSAFDVELALAKSLATLIERHAPQGDLYGQR